MLHWTKLSVMLIPFEIVSISTEKMCINTCLFPSRRWKPQITCNLYHAGFLYCLHVEPKGASTSVYFGYLFKYLSQQSSNFK